MTITIGIRGAARELTIDLDVDSADFAAQVTTAINTDTLLDLTDAKRQRYLIPARSITYVNIGEQVERRVGFAIN